MCPIDDVPKVPEKPKVEIVMTQENSIFQTNPLLQTDRQLDFAKVKAEHVVPAIEAILDKMEKNVSQLEKVKNPSWENFMVPLDRGSNELGKVIGPVSHLKGVKDSDELRAAWEQVQPKIVMFSLRVAQSPELYAGYKHILANETDLSPEQKRILEHNIKDAKLSGIELKDKEKEQFNALQKEAAELQTRFSNNVLDGTKQFSLVVTNKEQLEGVPDFIYSMTADKYNDDLKEGEEKATAEKGPWKLSLDPAVFLQINSHCKNRDIREKMYRAHITRASSGDIDNTPIISRILELRKQKALLLGFDTYAELSIAKKMAPSVDAVETLLSDLKTSSKEPGKKEFDLVQRHAEKLGFKEPLKQWDVGFYSERLKEEKFQYSEEDIKPYFQYPIVLDGLFNLINKLFEVSIKESEQQPEVWQEDVKFYDVFDREGNKVAGFYLDPYSRPGEKRGGAWMDSYQSRMVTSGETQIPIAYIVCNGTPPTDGKPSLMKFSEVTTLFHEFGHGLQHMLTKVDYLGASGINGVEWDAVELPSQFMENWCYHKPTLIGLTSHIETGEKLPDQLFQKVYDSKNYLAAMLMLRQLQFALVDMELHHKFDPKSGESPTEVMQRIARDTSVLPPLPEDRFLCGFSHIFAGGYSAGYYSYKWAEVLSADAFQAFEESGLNDPKAVHTTGQRFRDTVLALGGGKHPMEVFKEFRGREPKVNALLEHNGLLADSE